MAIITLDLCLLCVGDLKDKNYRALMERYVGMIQYEARIEIREIKDSTRAKESAQLLEALDKLKGYSIVLAEEGRQFTSRKFAEHIANVNKKIVLVIGGPDGLDDSIKKKADLLFSLSACTFTHEIARVLCAEQVYRACSILHNHKYHRD